MWCCRSVVRSNSIERHRIIKHDIYNYLFYYVLLVIEYSILIIDINKKRRLFYLFLQFVFSRRFATQNVIFFRHTPDIFALHDF